MEENKTADGKTSKDENPLVDSYASQMVNEEFEFNIEALTPKQQIEFQWLLSSGVRIKSVTLTQHQSANASLKKQNDELVEAIQQIIEDDPNIGELPIVKKALKHTT